MASLRGATILWDNVEIAVNAISPPAYVPDTNVAIFISNNENVAHTFKVQVAESGKDRGGLNEFNSTNPPDGGLIWYDLYKKDISGIVSLSLAGNDKACIDLSPFAAQLVRLVCTAGSAGDVTAIVASYGPN